MFATYIISGISVSFLIIFSNIMRFSFIEHLCCGCSIIDSQLSMDFVICCLAEAKNEYVGRVYCRNDNI